VLFDLARPLRALANRLERGDGAAASEARTEEVLSQAHLLQELAGVLGLKAEAKIPHRPAEGGSAPDDAEIEERIEARRAAKAARDYATADRIRDELRSRGIELIDRPGGHTEWIRRGGP
jgi:cysteinyl-tRNA synthetase